MRSFLVALAALPLRALAAPQHHDDNLLSTRSLLGSSFGQPRDQEVDYLVIGGGTGGLAIASRLAEQTSKLVAVVEAGGFYEITSGNISQIPAYDGLYVGKDLDDWHPGIDWGFAVEPQAGFKGEVCHYARGKCLGGSSGRNYMAYQRPTKQSLQQWADKVGDNSYTWDALLPFYEKSIAFTPPDKKRRFANCSADYDESVLGDGSGPIPLTFMNYCQGFASWAKMALLEIGHKSIPNFQSGKLIGQSYEMFTVNPKTSIRESSETSFLRRALKYPNFLVFTQSMGKKILFDDKKRATGAIIELGGKGGKKFTIKARKEVILAAGAFQSPQLLMVSGIGPAATLKKHGIKVVADRPGVGQNMHDHLIHAPSYRVNVVTQSSFANPEFAAKAAKDFNERGAGMYANPTSDIFAWEKIPQHLRKNFSKSTLKTLERFPPDWPEVEYLSMGGYFGYQRNFATGDPNDGYQYASLAWGLHAPASRGNVTIKSADVNDHPVISPNWLTDRSDMEVSIAAFKRAREFFQAKAIKPILIGEEYFPGKNVSTDAQIEDFLRRSTSPMFHASCTCAMGKKSDPMAVVDSKTRVIGVKGLRIVDASAFPLLPPGHPQATIYALAEKIACDMSGAC